MKRTMRGWLHLFVTGFTMGAADIVPGVSGGTMAFIMGIYTELIENIAELGTNAIQLLPRLKVVEFFKRIPFPFFLVLGTGIGTAILTFAGLISHLLETQPAYIFSFFGGLILASAISICGMGTFTRGAWLSLIICMVLTGWLVGLNPMEQASHSLPVLFVSGMIAISAMILPGISGSFLLLLLGQYKYIIEAVHERDLLVVGTVAAGCGIGILLAVHVVNFFLHRFRSATIAGLVGVMLGSLRLVVAKVQGGLAGASELTVPLLIVAGLFLFGFLLVTILDQVQSKQNPLCRLVLRPSAGA